MGKAYARGRGRRSKNAASTQPAWLNAKGPPRRTGADLIGAPKGIRTPDLLFRRQTLYPAELWAHLVFVEKNRSP